MQTKQYLVLSVAALLAFTALSARAEHEKKNDSRKQAKASEFIGKDVKNEQDESLGKVDDFIFNPATGHVPFAIISHGGVLGAGRTRTAVPMSELRCSEDGKNVVLSATKEQLKNANRTPADGWDKVSTAEWTKSVDGYYGMPTASTRDENYREHYRDTGKQDTTGNRLYVRDPLPKGAEMLMQPADAALCEKVCDAIDNVQVSIANGNVVISGTVESEQARRNVEAKVKSVQGVQRVENRLKVR